MYQHFMAQDGFAPFSQRETLIPSVRPISSGCAGVDEASAGHKTQHEHAMRHLAFVDFQK